ncbi:MAG TPA: hypothetical protein VE982_07780 [Gaiellaceae bacterium]|nr:hypothetical protein [Gaiellaceae bacterium]
MQVRLALILALGVLAAGCGGGGGDAPAAEAASLAPADALAYLTIDTSSGSAQLQSASSVLDKFPFKGTLLRSIRSSLAKNGVNVAALRSSIGPELDVAVLNVDGNTSAVGFTQPKDEKAFDAQLARGPTPSVHATIGGWTVFADTQAALDAVRHRTASLAAAAAFRAALMTVPNDAIVRAYASTGGLQAALGRAAGTLGAAGTTRGPVAKAQWVAAALTSQDGAFKLEVHAKGETAAGVPTGAGLAGQIPSGSLVALSLAGGGRGVSARVKQQTSALSRRVGFDLGALLDALGGPVIAYVKAGTPIPEVTVAARPPHPARTAKAVGQLVVRLAHGAGTAVPTPVQGGLLDKVDLGSIAFYYGVSHDEVVVTDSANALSELQSGSARLADDGIFKEAKDGAGMPDASQGFLYVDLEHGVPALQEILRLANRKLPATVAANIRPLRSLLAFGSRDGDVESFVVYLKTS